MFRGSIPALVTPFKHGELDLGTLKSLVDWHIAEGSTGLVTVGTTGESPTLSHAEHQRVIEEVVAAAAGRVPVIAGAGSNNTVEGISLIRHAEKVGAAAALVVTPYYNKPTQAGLIAHYTALHDCSDLPIIIYNIPGRSVVDMSPDTMGELATLPRNVVDDDRQGTAVMQRGEMGNHPGLRRLVVIGRHHKCGRRPNLGGMADQAHAFDRVVGPCARNHRHPAAGGIHHHLDHGFLFFVA